MPRVVRVTETGTERVRKSRVLRWLRVLREDLWTVRADPLPAFVHRGLYRTLCRSVPDASLRSG